MEDVSEYEAKMQQETNEKVLKKVKIGLKRSLIS